MCEITLLGRFEVAVDGLPVPEHAWRHSRAAQLVKLLALTDRHRLHREQIMDMLWPDSDVSSSSASLRKAVHFARAALGSEGAVVGKAEMLSLFPDGKVRVDAEEFEQQALEALRSSSRLALSRLASSGFAEATNAYAGDLLPEERYAPWAEAPRERLRSLNLRVLKAAGEWERVLDVDPADEEAHRSLMRRALEAGDRRVALKQFEKMRERLRADLGIGPDHASVVLYEQALALGGDDLTTAEERARGLVARALVHLNSGDFDAAERVAGEARTLALDANLGREMGEASAVLAIVANMQGRWSDLFRAEFAESMTRDPSVAAFVFDAHLCLAEFSLCSPSGLLEVAEYADEFRDLAEHSDSTQGRALADLLLGEAALFSGRLTEAHDLLTSSAALHAEAHASSGQALALQRLAELRLAGGDRDGATRLLRRGLRLAGQSWLEPHLAVRMYGVLVAASERPATAVRRLREADDALAGRDICPPCSMGFRIEAAQACARAGRLDEARRRMEVAERLTGMWPTGSWHASLWEARAGLRQAEGDAAQAAALYREAAKRFADLGRPLDRARCLAAVETPTNARVNA